eukprot:scaffold655081_cov56-Prasinocladus_malaysianus.AAC.1
MFRALQSLEFVHSLGVAHGSLSAACLLVNTVDHAAVDSLRVRLYNFGFASLPGIDVDPNNQ